MLTPALLIRCGRREPAVVGTTEQHARLVVGKRIDCKVDSTQTFRVKHAQRQTGLHRALLEVDELNTMCHGAKGRLLVVYYEQLVVIIRRELHHTVVTETSNRLERTGVPSLVNAFMRRAAQSTHYQFTIIVKLLRGRRGLCACAFVAYSNHYVALESLRGYITIKRIVIHAHHDS